MEFLIWEENDDQEYGWLTVNGPDEINKTVSKAVFGISMLSCYPNEEMVWDLDKKKGKLVADAVNGYVDIKVVSTRFREYLEKESGAEFEFYPLRIRDHRGRVLPEQYWIANLMVKIPCMNAERSVFEWDSISEDQVYSFARLILDETKIPEGTKIFRLAEKEDLWLVEEQFAISIVKEMGFKGAGFQYLENYGIRGLKYTPDPEAGY